jgi:tetratricopeptide (TPR) repeat protein
VSACVFASAAFAETGSRERGVRLAREGRCQAALPDLDTALLETPADPDLALLAGQCRIRLRRYTEAAQGLASAAEGAPDRADLWLALAKARYHADDLPGAQTALDQAGSGLPDDAEVWLYRGMLELRRGDNEAAARSLDRARALDAERVEPIASYYAGLALAEARDVDAADAALERVTTAWPGTDWSRQADQQLRRLRAGPARHAWLVASASFEHDSNVVLLGRDVSRPSDVSDESDERGVWTANGGLDLYRDENATVGAMASYRGTTHTDLHSFDAHFPSVTVWIDLALAESTVGTARYDFGYAWLDGDPFLALNNWLLSVTHGWAEAGTTEVYGRTTLDDYFFDSDDVTSTCVPGFACGPDDLDERSARRRSGWALAGGIGQTLPLATGDLPLSETALRAGYDFEHFKARGREYTHGGHALGLGFSTGLPLELGLDVDGSFAYKQYRHPSTFPDPPIPNGSQYMLSGVRRRDEVYRVETRLTRELGEYLSLSTHYRYVDNQSNRDVFDYDQHIVGVTLTVGIGREL